MRHPAHDHCFEVVWKGQWYRLASLSYHNHKKVDLTKPARILLDRLSHETLAPLNEIAFPPNPI